MIKRILKRYISVFLFIFMAGDLINYIPINAETIYKSSAVKEKLKDDKKETSIQKEPKVTIDPTVKLKANSKNQKITGKGKVGDTVIFKNKNNKKLGKVTVNENGQFEGIISQKLSEGDQISIYEQKGNEDKNASESVVMNVMQSSISKKQSPALEVKTDIESLQSMLTNQAITGTGVAGNNIIIFNGSYIWVGKVAQDGSFNIKTKGLKKGDVAFIIERNNNNERSSLQISFSSTENKLTITKQPKYIIMDPNGQTPTFVDDKGKTPELSGYWSSKFSNSNREFDLCLISSSDIERPWNAIWYSNCVNETDEPSLFDNKKLINNFENISLLALLNGTSGYKPPLKNVSPQKEYKLVMDMGMGTGNYGNWEWTYASNAIPFYIKAPKVTVHTDPSSMNNALTKQIVSGTGQIGDTVTITNKGQNYTGKVNDNGNYNIIVKNLEKGDKLSITEINGTGDKSISDPVIFDTTQIPTVLVKTDIESLQSMLTNQTITGMGRIGCTVTIKDGKATWTGTVGKNETFTINTPGLKKLDTVSITESEGNKESSPVQIAFNSNENELTISKQPKYVIMDPNGKTPTFVDENGKTPEISGYWSTVSNGNLNGFYIEIGLDSNMWQWFSPIKDLNLLKNNTIINNFNNISLNSALENYSGKSNSYNLKELAVNQKYKLFGAINTSNGDWIYSEEKKAIPFYIKAPKVNVNTDPISMNNTLTKQIVSGTGQIGDTVTITNKGQTYTGKVDDNGIYDIMVKNLKKGDKPSITETNGTGDKSVSDPVIFDTTQIPTVLVKTDMESLQSMLTNQIITGIGVPGDTVTIKYVKNIWTGTVEKDGTFTIKTSGLKKLDTISITESDGKKESFPVQITFNATENKLTITKQPKYVIMDPNNTKVTFTDENGNDAIFNGTWSSTKIGENLFTIQIGDKENPISNYDWYGGESAGISLLNNLIVNEFNYNASNGLKVGIDTLKELSTKKQYCFLLGMREDGWTSTVKIPFYIKAPKVTVNKDLSSMNNALTKQMVSGTGQIGDTVTITNKGQNYTSKVDEKGVYNIIVKNLKKGDKPSITETNGTGEKSVSDPVIFDTTQIPTVLVKTDIESLQFMLTSQTVTGMGRIGCTVTIKDGKDTWTGTVGKNETFTIKTSGLKKLDTISITESDGKKESLPVQMTFNATENKLTITKQPKYVIMDPNGKTPTFIDENGKIPEISGNWYTTTSEDLQELQVGIGSQEITMSSPFYWNDIKSPDILKNTKLINNFNNLSILSGLEGKEVSGGTYKSLTELPTNSEYGLFFGMESQDNWNYATLSQSIPFYIKAPKVEVLTGEENLMLMVENGIITGSGQIGDTIKIVVKGTSYVYTGKVNINGKFNIPVDNLSYGDELVITQTNGTGDKSVSDPITIKFGEVPPGTQYNLNTKEKSLGIVFTPKLFDFNIGDLTLGMPIKAINSNEQYIGISDDRNTSTGWHLTAQAEPFKDKNGKIVSIGTITMNKSIEHVSVTQDGNNFKSYTLDSSIPEDMKSQAPVADGEMTKLSLNNTSTSIASANEGKGQGTWAVKFSNIKLDAGNPNIFSAGTYEGKIIWNLSNTP